MKVQQEEESRRQKQECVKWMMQEIESRLRRVASYLGDTCKLLFSDWLASLLFSDWLVSLLFSDWLVSLLFSDWLVSLLLSDWLVSLRLSDWLASLPRVHAILH